MRQDSTYYAGTASRYNGALRTAVRLPCDMSRLANSPDLPGSIYDAGEALFGTAERDELLKSLDFDLQTGWAPQWPTLHAGLDLLRYNRIEGALGWLVGDVAPRLRLHGSGDWAIRDRRSAAQW